MAHDDDAIDQIDAERLLTLRGDFEQAVERSRLAGGAPEDAVICLGFLVGQLAAQLPGAPPLAAVLASVGRAAFSGHRAMIAKAARQAAERASTTDVYPPRRRR